MLFFLIIVFILTLTGCSASNPDTDNMASTVSPTTMETAGTTDTAEDFAATISAPVQNTSEPEFSDNISYNIYDKNIGLYSWDFDVAYQMCQDAILDYYAYPDNSGFDRYIENNQLKEYLEKSAEWASHKRYVSKIGIAKAELCNNDSNELKWYYFHIFITFPDGGETVEIIVKESLNGESLVISDWFFPGNLVLDDQTRKNSGPINDPDIWENAIFADEMVKKAQEIIDLRDNNAQ